MFSMDSDYSVHVRVDVSVFYILTIVNMLG